MIEENVYESGSSVFNYTEVCIFLKKKNHFYYLLYYNTVEQNLLMAILHSLISALYLYCINLWLKFINIRC